MALYIRSMTLKSPRSGMYTIDVEFAGDQEGAYELQKMSVSGEPVSIVPGSTGYAKQCQKYESRIAELRTELENRVTGKEVSELRKLRADFEDIKKRLEVAVRSNSSLLAQVRELQRQDERIRLNDARLGIVPIGIAENSAREGSEVSIFLSQRAFVEQQGPVGVEEPSYPAVGVVEATSTGKKAPKKGEKQAPSRFNVLEVDEAE